MAHIRELRRNHPADDGFVISDKDFQGIHGETFKQNRGRMGGENEQKRELQ
jgi:hypothetical protein